MTDNCGWFVHAPEVPGTATFRAETALRPPTPSTPRPTQGAAVLTRVAYRVRQRLQTEQAMTAQSGDGGHAASLTPPPPLWAHALESSQ
ncbi:HaaA family cyclophane-containing RiPP peptide [Streptomyces toyocaensis]